MKERHKESYKLKPKIKTNADRIRALNDIDLAISRVVALRAGFYYAVDCGLYKSFQSAVQAEFEWLKQEAI